MPSEDTQFRPGQSGNPAGRPKRRRTVSEVLAEALERDSGDGRPVIDAIVDRWLKIVLEGEIPSAVAALRELLNRLEGKVPSKLEADVEHGGGLTIRVEYADDDAGERFERDDLGGDGPTVLELKA